MEPKYRQRALETSLNELGRQRDLVVIGPDFEVLRSAIKKFSVNEPSFTGRFLHRQLSVHTVVSVRGALGATGATRYSKTSREHSIRRIAPAVVRACNLNSGSIRLRDMIAAAQKMLQESGGYFLKSLVCVARIA